jgi:hypothetical protein
MIYIQLIYITFIYKFVGYFYLDVIVKYDESSTPQIDGKTSKKTFYSSLQRI